MRQITRQDRSRDRSRQITRPITRQITARSPDSRGVALIPNNALPLSAGAVNAHVRVSESKQLRIVVIREWHKAQKLQENDPLTSLEATRTLVRCAPLRSLLRTKRGIERELA